MVAHAPKKSASSSGKVSDAEPRGERGEEEEEEEKEEERPTRAIGAGGWQTFDPTWVNYYETALFIGPRMCGKTTACIILLRAMNLNRGFVQCGSPEWKKTWGKVIPMLYLQRGKGINKAYYDRWMGQMEKISIEIEKMVTEYEAKLEAEADRKLRNDKKQTKEGILKKATEKKWSEEKTKTKLKKGLEKLKRERLTTIQEEINKKKNDYKQLLAEPESLFSVLDDLGNGTKKGTLWSPEMQELMNMGRHYLAAVMVIVQNMMDFPPGIRQGLDWIFVWPGAMGPKEIDKLMAHYIPAELFTERRDFMKALRDITQGQNKRTCMVIHRTGESHDVRDRIFRWNPYMSDVCKNGIPKGYLGDAAYKAVYHKWYNGKEGYMWEAENPKTRMKQEKKMKQQPSSLDGTSKMGGGSGKTTTTNAIMKMTPEEKQRKVAEWEAEWEEETLASVNQGKRQIKKIAGTSAQQAHLKTVWKKTGLGLS